MRIDSTLIAALLVLSLAGCAVGPDFKPPAGPNVSGYTTDPLTSTAATPDVVGGDAQRFVAGADLSGEWWTLFHSKALNALIERALANNHDLKAAQAALAAGARKCPCATRRLLSESRRRLLRQSPEATGFARPGARRQRTGVRPLHTAAGYFLCARCLRSESPHGGIAAGAGPEPCASRCSQPIRR